MKIIKVSNYTRVFHQRLNLIYQALKRIFKEACKGLKFYFGKNSIVLLTKLTQIKTKLSYNPSNLDYVYNASGKDQIFHKNLENPTTYNKFFPHIYNGFRYNAKETTTKAYPTKDCKDTVEWRKKLIEAANHNILVSGNYCGDKIFDDFLELIKSQMGSKPDLKVIILSSPNFIKRKKQKFDNIKKLEELKEGFPKRFEIIETPDIFVSTEKTLKKSTNHTKCLLIDYGKYFILGGSGIKDNFSRIGLDHNQIDEKEESNDILDKVLLPGAFRDEDFVFLDENLKENGAGRKIYEIMLDLCKKWKKYNKAFSKNKIKSKIETNYKKQTVTDILIEEKKDKDFHSASSKKAQETSILLLEDLEKFNQSETQIFFTGPELTKKNLFLSEMIKKIEKAKSSIEINHMYFHPPKKLMNAFCKAANKGVKIRIVTNGVFQNSPNSHKFFGPRNKYNYFNLRSLVDSDKRNNIEVFEFEQHKKGIHKKAMIIDKKIVIAGSGNMGYKSLETTSDDEINFIAKSKEFAKKTKEIFDKDVNFSRKIDFDSERLSLNDRILSLVHFILAPLVG